MWLSEAAAGSSEGERTYNSKTGIKQNVILDGGVAGIVGGPVRWGFSGAAGGGGRMGIIWVVGGFAFPAPRIVQPETGGRNAI